MDAQSMIDGSKKHSVFTWSAGRDVHPLPLASAQGSWLTLADGRRLLDFNSQSMNANLGHKHPHMVAKLKAQLDAMPHAAPAFATQIRATVSQALSATFPEAIDKILYCLSGAEANENAIKAARLYTGRHKILARYRSYHGATNATMQLTGDPRRLANEPGMPGVVHVMDPRPYDYSFGQTDAEIVANNLTYLEEVITYEGPDKIAAMFIETVTGTNGILAPPEGYLKGLKALLEKYGILLVCDEVMAGFGRTGKMFAFEHGDIVPDIVTMAKGLTSAYAPLGCMAVSDDIADHFRENVFWGGLTYSCHALSMATAEAVLQVMLDEDMVGNAQRMGVVMREEMDRLVAKHPSVREGRCIGLFGMMDVQKNSRGDLIAPYNGSHPAMTAFGKFLKDNGLFTFVRWSHFMCNPPLCITEEQLREAFAIIDRGLDITDEAFEG